MRVYDNIRKIATGQGDNYSTGCLLDYICFINYYKMIAIYLSKNKHLMLIQKHYRKLALLEIEIEQKLQHYFSLLKKQKKPF